MPVTTGLRANLGPRVVCHCFPCLLLPSPGGTVLGTEGSAAAALPILDGDSTAGQGAAPQLCGFGDVAWGGCLGIALQLSPAPLHPCFVPLFSFHAHPNF